RTRRRSRPHRRHPAEKETTGIAENLGEVAHRPRSAGPDAGTARCEALDITVSHDNATRTATVRSRPSHAYR
ncbi:hypothetical protein, partial [Streptomyces sp. PU_AKi4]|uniref:hypothetical protein n=1 Tax=Streptomyces sp. PU_AKi4 TaxID=2800809 RepID=UPI0035232574